VIDHGPGLGSVTWVAALVPLAATIVALCALRLESNRPRAVAAACPAE
jgi:DHA1 family inner membrane transport protein